MTRKLRFWFLLAGLSALVMNLALPSTTHAGGWAVVTLDDLPENVAVGQVYALGFTVRQHGRTPWVAEQIQINAIHQETRERLTFTALPDETPGHYQAELLFTKPGNWQWEVMSGLFPEAQPMPTIAVAGEASAASTVKQTIVPPAVLFGLAAVVCLAAGSYLVVRRRRLPLAWMAAAALVVIGGLAFGLLSSAQAGMAENIPNTGTENGQATTSLAATGHELFLAKGCVVCHVNDRAMDQSAEFSVSMGPNLTKYSNDPAYLRTFLLSPQSVKKGTEMPTLGLKEQEIEALIAFLNE